LINWFGATVKRKESCVGLGFQRFWFVGILQLTQKKKRWVCFCWGKQKKKRLNGWVLLFLLLYLPTQSMQLFVGTDCAIAMKKPNNTKSCSYCSAREGGREELPGDSRGGGGGGD